MKTGSQLNTDNQVYNQFASNAYYFNLYPALCLLSIQFITEITVAYKVRIQILRFDQQLA